MFFIKTCSLKCAVAPRHASDILTGASEYLDTYIMKHVTELNGVLISYSNIKPQKTTATLYPNNPYFYLNIIADFILFSPKIGSTLLGHVNKTSSDHIGIMILGCFNASIPSEQIPFDYDHVSKTWGDINLGCIIKFKVTDLTISHHILTVSGSLKGKGLGTVSIDDYPKMESKIESNMESDMESDILIN